MRILKLLTLIFFVTFLLGACSDDEEKKPFTKKKAVVEDMSGFARGADVSWLTEMEKEGVVFYNTEGTEMECMSLLKSLGMNSIRLRVWVNPVDGWCNKTDFLVKAKRANDLGMRVMVDFHYSDSWADPGKQNKPAAWEILSFTELCEAVSEHTTDVLSSLKAWGVTPEWVQVGNETRGGMLWPDGDAHENMAQYATLNNCGYDAVKAIFPEAIVIVHVDNGHQSSLYTYLFDGLKNNGGKWDAIGMSLYPETDTWQSLNDGLIANAQYVTNRYNTPVVICEVGMSWTEEEAAYGFLSDLISRTKDNDDILGLFYWEPQAHNGWKAYSKGAFNDLGSPTKAMDAFGE